jgi:hypothetical protein
MDEIYAGLLLAPVKRLSASLGPHVIAAGKSRLGNLIPLERPASGRRIRKPAILDTFAAAPSRLSRHFICSRLSGAHEAILAVTRGGPVITHDELLTDLQDSKTDLARVVEAVVRDRVPYIVVPSAAVRAWEEREPHHRAKVAAWLAEQNVAMVQV